ncbi:Hydrophobic seed protein domain [Dillenia turbinata]|uniref:Hydrophobic seed protein domain n=1 Tax=Dillenia turbinata TaxID=194707 RepID=A0AAN8Z4P1_9MAGN
MASRVQATSALLIALNLLFFSLVSANHKACPPPPPSTAKPATCPKDTLKLGVCANLLEHLLKIKIGTPPKTPCCSLIEGLVDLEAAVCLCTAIKANVLGLKLDIPLSLSLLLNYCGNKVPEGFKCA